MSAALQLFVLAAGALQVAAYSPTLNTTKFCGVSEAVSVSTYTLINNIWGPKLDSTNPKGFQCGQFTGRNGNTSVSWNINYQWTLNKGFVKGYTNMQQNQDVGHRIYNIYKIPAVWNYTVNVNSNLDYNVAYDFYTAKSADLKSPYTNEIMVWLSSQYAKPTSSHFNASNKSVPIFSNILLNGYTWDLYQGVGGTGLNAAGLNVLSFYNNGPARTNFKGDMKLFLNYLISKKLIVGTDFLNVVGGGSEVIKADNTTIKSSYYSVDVIPNLVFQSSTVAPPPSSSVKSTSTAKVSSTVKPASSSTKKSSSSVKVSSTVKATSTAKTTAKVTSSTKKSSSSVKATSTVKK